MAEAIEVLYADGLDELYEQLAYHFDRAGEPAKAIEYLVKAGQKAAGRFANAEAITHFDRGAGAGRPDRRGGEPIRLLRAAVHLELFHGREAAADFLWLLERALRRGDRPAELEALLGLGLAYYLRGLDDQQGDFMTRWRDDAASGRWRSRASLDDRRGIVRAL